MAAVSLSISKRLMAEVHAYAEQHYPEEVAGLLLGESAGSGRQVRRVLPLANRFESGQRARRYLIEPLDMLEAERQADEFGLQIVGVFHSHPDHPPQPSNFDLEMAVPWYFYLITGVQDGRARESRVWRLEDDHSRLTELALRQTEEDE